MFPTVPRLPLRPAVFALLLLGALGRLPAAELSPSAAELGRPILRYYSPGEHLAGRDNRTLVQTDSGTVWMSAGIGLLSFDGRRWRVPPVPPDGSAGPRQFALTSDGSVHVAGAGVIGYLVGSGPDARFVSLADRLPAPHRNTEEFRSVVAAGDAVYFCDAEKIAVWRQERFAILPFVSTPGARAARLHRVDDRVYVTAVGQPLVRVHSDRLETVADAPVFRTEHIVTLEAGPAPGSLLALTADAGFHRLDADGTVHRHPTPTDPWIAGKRIYAALRLADGSRVVAFSAVSGDGGMRFDPAGRYVGPLDTTIGIVVKTLRDFHVDREHGLWIGNDQGIVRMEWPSPATVFDFHNGLGQGAVADVVRHAGSLHAATSEGVFRLRPAEPSGRPARFERLLPQPGFALASHRSGLLVLTPGALLRLDGDRPVVVARLAADPGQLAVSPIDPDLVHVGTVEAFHTFRFAAGLWQEAAPPLPLPEPCHALLPAADGTVWIATSGGTVLRVNPGGAFDTFSAGRELPAGFAAAALAAAGPDLALAPTAGPAAPHRFRSASGDFAPLAGPGSFADDVAGPATAITVADPARPGAAPRLWVAHTAALHRLDPGPGTAERFPHHVVAAAGRIARIYGETTALGRTLWLAGDRGLVRVDLDRPFPPRVPFAAALIAPAVAPGTRLPSDHAPFTLAFHAPRQQPQANVLYRTRVAGLDRTWSSWQPATERTFSALPPGRYTFEVVARDADGVVSAPATLAFVVVPPWWRTGWALLGAAAALGGLISGIVRLRTRALRRQTARLEALVAERTRTLAAQNAELVRLHRLELDEKISARLAEEKARLEVLRYQLNPHFLFNTLASISSALPAGASTARHMLDRLARFCRLTLHRTDDREWTTLGAELDLLQAYLEIERSRWGDLLDIDLHCDPILAPERLPHFLLLPLLENALKYGRATSPDRVGLRLHARRDPADGSLVVEVANTGTWVEPSAPHTVSTLGIGLENLRERLARYYPRQHRLDIASTGGWVVVTLRLFPADSS